MCARYTQRSVQFPLRIAPVVDLIVRTFAQSLVAGGLKRQLVGHQKTDLDQNCFAETMNDSRKKLEIGGGSHRRFADGSAMNVAEKMVAW